VAPDDVKCQHNVKCQRGLDCASSRGKPPPAHSWQPNRWRRLLDDLETAGKSARSLSSDLAFNALPLQAQETESNATSRDDSQLSYGHVLEIASQLVGCIDKPAAERECKKKFGEHVDGAERQMAGLKIGGHPLRI